MYHILKLLDKTGKTIILTKERWTYKANSGKICIILFNRKLK